MPRSTKLVKLPKIIRRLLIDRGYCTDQQQLAFLNPDYQATNYNPLLLPGMARVVERLALARSRQELVTIYCDYDVDGTTAAALLLDALPKFGLVVNYYVPDRFKDGYGLNKEALKKLKQDGSSVVLTVDNGTVSFDEARYAERLGLDLLITDHHTPKDVLPAAVAVVNPKLAVADNESEFDDHYLYQGSRADVYPFLDLSGCGVAFKLVQALQRTWLDDLPMGQEKWLLDLVALSTVCDLVGLVDENRTLVYWGLEVLKKTRRPGLKVLAGVAGLDLAKINARDLGFVIGPRLNAAGRLGRANVAVDLLSTTDSERAWQLANQLNDMNNQRKELQRVIFKQAIKQIEPTEPIAIAVGNDWHEGVIGIVASKVQETTGKPTFIFNDNGQIAKASGRSFGDFSIASAINATSTLLIKGGGHTAAGGVSIKSDQLSSWRQAVNSYYRSLKLVDQTKFIDPVPEVTISDLAELTPLLMSKLAALEPCGIANPVPIFLLQNVAVAGRRLMGDKQQHVKYTFQDEAGHQIQAVAFDAADRFVLDADESDSVLRVNAVVELTLNEWNYQVSVQGRLLALSNVNDDPSG